MSARATHVIVGGGQAGGRAAGAMRAAGFDGDIVILGDEPARPYERPPLSKGVLTGEAADDVVYPRTPGQDDELGITVRTGIGVTAVDRRAKRVTLADGGTLGYDKLLLATGSRVKRLPVTGADLAGIHYLRTLADSHALRDALTPGARLVVVGGGYIGLEVAAAARKRDCAVTVLEASETVMRRQIAPELGRWFADVHRKHGVEIVTGVKVARFDGADGRVDGVSLADGTTYPADVVIVGVGVAPNVDLAADAGLACDDGIVVDTQGRTEDPDVFAAGDVTRHPNPLLGRSVRLESWQNAQFQADAAGRTMAGEPTEYRMVPWFWSDQFDINLQMLGLPETPDRVVWRGDPATESSFALFHLQDGVVVGAQAVNQGKAMAPARKMIEGGLRPDPEALANPEVTLKKVLKAAG